MKKIQVEMETLKVLSNLNLIHGISKPSHPPPPLHFSAYYLYCFVHLCLSLIRIPTFVFLPYFFLSTLSLSLSLFVSLSLSLFVSLFLFRIYHELDVFFHLLSLPHFSLSVYQVHTFIHSFSFLCEVRIFFHYFFFRPLSLSLYHKHTFSFVPFCSLYFLFLSLYFLFLSFYFIFIFYFFK
jgi:hypothetical protein